MTVNSSTTYFSKIKKFIMFMALAAQLFLFFTVTVSYIRYRISITNDIVEFQQNHYNTQLNSLFMKIDNMILQFDNSKATELCSVNIMKMSTDELEEKYETMCKNLVYRTIFFRILGYRNKQQLSYVFKYRRKIFRFIKL